MKRIMSFALFAVLLFPLAAIAAEHEHPMAGHQAGGMDCKAMMEHQKEAQAKLAEMDAQLQKRGDAMNTATGQAKVDAMAAVINELVTQRKTMHAEMEKRQSAMMEHMSAHMAAGGKMMADCPMMKGAAAKTEKTETKK